MRCVVLCGIPPMYKISAIKLTGESSGYKNTDGTELPFLEPISKINIFVGSNNSGKSRLMRRLSDQTNFEVKLADLEEQNEKIFEQLNTIQEVFQSLGIESVDTIGIWGIQRLSDSLRDVLSMTEDKYGSLRDTMNEWKKIEQLRSTTPRSLNTRQKRELAENLKTSAASVLDLLKEIPFFSKDTLPEKVYIPTLRGLRPFDSKHTDFYAQRTRRDYFRPQTSNPADDISEAYITPEIFTGISLFEYVTDLLLGNNEQRKQIAKYQEFISEALFEGNSVALIPNQKNGVVTVKIGKEKEQPIHHLGDGIQSAIILSFLPFVKKDPTFFFIEEPEMYLHPGLQRKILNFYASRENHLFFLTTHSNHFLDITIDIKNVSIFTFRKILADSEDDEVTPSFTIESVDSGNESSLELLGVRNSSVFLVNATIWVEGITDRWYLRRMLNSYTEHLLDRNALILEPEEDVHYSFVEYGGANITHWSFLDCEEHPIEVKRLCAKALVIVDKDGDAKMQRKEDLKNILGNRLIVLPGREIENVLPYKVIKKVVSLYENSPGLEIKDYSYENYHDKYLGTFIENTMLKKNPTRKGGYKEKSGTLKNKVAFCEKALKDLEYTDLPAPVQNIVKRIYEFICAQNS
jgi:predicted ATP-dependent endonuclease of OLD family